MVGGKERKGKKGRREGGKRDDSKEGGREGGRKKRGRKRRREGVREEEGRKGKEEWEINKQSRNTLVSSVAIVTSTHIRSLVCKRIPGPRHNTSVPITNLIVDAYVYTFLKYQHARVACTVMCRR